jgi:signal transduction histidine kinase
VNGYETQLVLLFQNILSNSIKFRSTQPLQIDLTYRTLNKNHLFSFQDNGIGIPEKEHDRVFNLFKRVHNNLDYEGIGMGLSICKKIIAGVLFILAFLVSTNKRGLFRQSKLKIVILKSI